MNDEPRVVVYETDDWIALYVDGELKVEGHSLNYFNILIALDIEFAEHYTSPDDMEHYEHWTFAPYEKDNPNWMRG